MNWFYTIAGKPLFRLEPTLPKGWILRYAQMDGRPIDHRYEDDGRLVMVFPQGLKPGQHVLNVGLDTDQVDWVPNEARGQGRVRRTAFPASTRSAAISSLRPIPRSASERRTRSPACTRSACPRSAAPA